MKSAVILFIFTALVFGSAAHAQTTTPGVKITKLSLTDDGGGMLIQTTPRHTLDAGCTSDFWLALATSAPNYEALLSMLITAQTRGSSVSVSATGVGNDFCNLSRLVLDE